MFEELEGINTRPEPFGYYTASDLWTDEHTSAQMLEYHLNDDIDASSRSSEFIARSVDWITAKFNISAGTRIADFGCGPGLYANRLAQQQAAVTGIDFSARSIQYAQEVAVRDSLSINYVNQNYLDFETTDRFDLILMIYCDFCALSPSQRATMLNKFDEMLEPGGSVLLDAYTLPAFNQREETASYEVNQLNGLWSPNQYVGFVNTFKYNEEKVVLDKFTVVEASKTKTVFNWLQYFSEETLENELLEYGFTAKEFYSNVAGAPFEPDAPEMAVVIERH